MLYKFIYCSVGNIVIDVYIRTRTKLTNSVLLCQITEMRE